MHSGTPYWATAALFHDIGLVKIPAAILYKPTPLTPEECQEVQKHPEIAVDLLQQCSEVSPESLRLIWEHHENADGSGYPQGLGLSEQHAWTPLLRLIDAYDALVCQRHYRHAQSPFQALKIIQQQWGPYGPVFHRQLLKKFVEFLAL
jgi:HD-GYP domain-containing protein (c-di-GMP phosphodiesterase class II)